MREIKGKQGKTVFSVVN